MALYKNLPHSRKKTEELPFYRPIDRVVDFLWENREKLFPYLVAVLVLLVVYGGYRLYGLRYESSASQMLEQGDLEGAVQKYPRANASQIARLKLGRKALEAKQYEEAIRWYQALADPHTNNSLYRV
ncbi:MAG: hypothetical protein HY073_00790, partial [Deltaproteobacteria bacterium]|nr:hypothetical protein [Deltaproteobacteria bacterium]